MLDVGCWMLRPCVRASLGPAALCSLNPQLPNPQPPSVRIPLSACQHFSVSAFDLLISACQHFSISVFTWTAFQHFSVSAFDLLISACQLFSISVFTWTAFRFQHFSVSVFDLLISAFALNPQLPNPQPPIDLLITASKRPKLWVDPFSDSIDRPPGTTASWDLQIARNLRK